MAKQKLITYENNTMSLSCRGEMILDKHVITAISFKGYPRDIGDWWTGFYKSKQVGDFVTDAQINMILSYNGQCNVVSKITKEGE